jgi:hypothetical protein
MGPEQYFDDAMAQLLSSRYARKFNKVSGAKVSFLGVSVARLESGEFGCLERFLAGIVFHVRPNDIV